MQLKLPTTLIQSAFSLQLCLLVLHSSTSAIKCTYYYKMEWNHIEYKYSPTHLLLPSDMKPEWQTHTKLPSVLLHVALSQLLSSLLRHSSISVDVVTTMINCHTYIDIVFMHVLASSKVHNPCVIIIYTVNCEYFRIACLYES